MKSMTSTPLLIVFPLCLIDRYGKVGLKRCESLRVHARIWAVVDALISLRFRVAGMRRNIMACSVDGSAHGGMYNRLRTRNAEHCF